MHPVSDSDPNAGVRAPGDANEGGEDEGSLIEDLRGAALQCLHGMFGVDLPHRNKTWGDRCGSLWAGRNGVSLRMDIRKGFPVSNGHGAGLTSDTFKCPLRLKCRHLAGASSWRSQALGYVETQKAGPTALK